MGTESLIVFLVCGFILLLIMLTSWYRRRRLAAKELQEPATVSRIHETIIDGQRTFRIATVTRRADGLNLDVYEIRLPRQNDPTSTATITLLPPLSRLPRGRNAVYGEHSQMPPPPFSTAINMPVPPSNDSCTILTSNNDESPLPPPRYDEVISISTISGSNKLLEAPATRTEAQPVQNLQLQS